MSNGGTSQNAKAQCVGILGVRPPQDESVFADSGVRCRAEDSEESGEHGGRDKEPTAGTERSAAGGPCWVGGAS
jgi:hypothetical protein